MRRIATVFFACLAVSGCASVPAPAPPDPAMLEMPGDDEAGAARLLSAYLVARGYTVRLLEGDGVEATGAGGAPFLLEPLLDPDGLDRLLVSRRYVVREGVDPGLVPAFAEELNAVLNVGVFAAYPPGLLYQASLPFLDRLDPTLLDAFIAFTGEVVIAVRQVEAGRGLLVEVEGPGISR